MKIDNKDYIIASIRERILMDEFDGQQSDYFLLNYTPVDGNEEWDGTLFSASTHHDFEIKVRQYYVDSFPAGWVIQRNKYDFLMKYKKNPLYICFTMDGALIWELSKQDNIQWELGSYNRSTVEKNGSQDKIVGNLDPNKAMIVRYKTSFFESKEEAIKIYYEKYQKK